MSGAAGPILVTGGSGQVAGAIAGLAGGRNLLRVGRPEWDFDRLEGWRERLAAIAPSLIVNAAAYTAVDRAETDAEAAYRANRDGPALLAEYCAGAGIPLIHISTDYVFDGAKGAPYVETDPTSPTGVYGASKLAGEQAVLASGARAIVLRTSWVYAPAGKNFVLTMLSAAARTDRLRVVADQTGCPTAAQDLAAVILRIADRLALLGWSDAYGGVFHAAGAGWTTWHGLAVAAFEEAARYGLRKPTVEAIATADWPTPARRPADSRLDCTKLGRVFGMALPHWRDGLSRTIAAHYMAHRVGAGDHGTV
jgi:dTDP-4-dehydrorhamnose reductase